MAGNHKKTYTADFLLLLISGGVPFGWQVSGWPPSIEVACVCWGITLLIFLHIVWAWTEKWNTILRLIILILIPTAVLYFAWNPVKKQYILQHNPTKNEAKIPNQWYLSIKTVHVNPNPAFPPIERAINEVPFRIMALVNDCEYSFPIDQMYWKPTSPSNANQTVPLPVENEKFIVKFSAITPREPVSFYRRLRPEWITNINTGLSPHSKSLLIKSLPKEIADTISLPVSDNETNDHNIGYIDITYEITTNTP